MLTSYYKNGYRTWKATTEYHFDIYYRELTEQINQAYQEIANHADEAKDDVLAALTYALKHAEDMFTYRSATTEEEVDSESDALKAAIDHFLDAIANGIDLNVVAGSVQHSIEYYNLQGQRILKPEQGVIIVRQGDAVKKIYVK